jgi:thiamine-phosphate pyrophosphorylase
MAETCLLCYITDRTAFPGDETTRRRRLLEKIAEAARARVDYIQLREKDLPIRELESLAREAIQIIAHLKTNNRELTTVLLVNSRTDVALAIGADGVHLRSDDVSPEEVRKVWCGQYEFVAGAPTRADSPRDPVTAVSCHSLAEVAQAAISNATFAVFAPVFEKKDAPNTLPAGLAKLHEACQSNIPVLALGGITLENARSCLEAGASGIAAIRLFQDNNLVEVVKHLRPST